MSPKSKIVTASFPFCSAWIQFATKILYMYNKTLISQHTFFGGFCGVLLICDVRALKCRWSFWVGWKRGTVYYLSKTVIFMFCFLYVIYWAHSYVRYLYSQWYGIGQLACLYNYTVMYKYIHVYTHEPSHLQNHYFNVCIMYVLYAIFTYLYPGKIFLWLMVNLKHVILMKKYYL